MEKQQDRQRRRGRNRRIGRRSPSRPRSPRSRCSRSSRNVKVEGRRPRMNLSFRRCHCRRSRATHSSICGPATRLRCPTPSARAGAHIRLPRWHDGATPPRSSRTSRGLRCQPRWHERASPRSDPAVTWWSSRPSMVTRRLADRVSGEGRRRTGGDTLPRERRHGSNDAADGSQAAVVPHLVHVPSFSPDGESILSSPCRAVGP